MKADTFLNLPNEKMIFNYHVVAVESKITKFLKLLWSATTCMNLSDFLTEHF